MSIPPPEPANVPAAPNPYAPQSPYTAQPGVPGVGYLAPPPRGLSITAMVLGIVGLVGFVFGGAFLSIGAVIFGHIGIRKEPAGRGMAIAGIVTGYAGIGIGVLLFLFLLIPFFLLLFGTIAVAGSSV